MGGRRDNVAVWEGTRHKASSHEATDVSHVGHQVRVVLIGDLTELRVVETSRVTTHTYTRQKDGTHG